MNQMGELVVLMYHSVVAQQSDIPDGRETGADLYDISLEGFKEQMGFLRTRIFPVLTVEDAQASAGMTKVILTFDDGEMNNFKNALPILQRLRFPAYFFVTSNRIGKKGYMGWEELKELRDADMFIGSHGLSHRILTELKDKDVQDELIGSKQILEQRLKINIDYLSIPRGFYNERVIRFAKEAGYKYIFVSSAQGALPENCFARVAVKGDWPLSRFKQALSGQSPIEERAGAAAKGFLKKVLGAVGYDKFRTTLLTKKR